MDKSKVTVSSKQDNGSINWLIEKDSLLTVGEIKIKQAAVITYNDTIRSIILILKSGEGANLALAFLKKYGFPNEKNKNIYDGFVWKTGKVYLSLSSNTEEYTAYYYDVQFIEALNKKLTERRIDDL